MNDFGLLIAFVAVVALAFSLLAWLTRRPCPACARYRAAELGERAVLCGQCGRRVRDEGQFVTPDREG